MKKISIAIIFASLSLLSYSQVFNTASILKPGSVSLGINPVFLDNDAGLFLHGGIGIKSGVDLAFHYGFLEFDDYFGADLEWRLVSGKPSISLITGVHKRYDTGLDLGLNLSFPIASNVEIYTGLDMDINFTDNDHTSIPVWLPLGVEIPIKKQMSFMFEAEIPLTNNDPIFGLGFMFYL